MRFRPFTRYALIFILSAGWGALFLPWNGFMDPDAFYHAKASMLLWAHGPLRSFPWLDLTLLGRSFADLHFGFHAFVAPFTAAFGMFQGLRIASVCLVGLFAAVFYASLLRLRIRFPMLWTALLLASPALLFRLVLGKATPLALTLFVAGIAAASLRRPRILAGISIVFALCYAGWIYLFGSVVLLASGDALYALCMQDGPIWKRLRALRWQEPLAVLIGGLAGMCVHPNFPGIFTLWWAQVVTIGLGTPYAHVNLGSEWLPSTFTGFMSAYALWMIIGLVGSAGLLFAPRKPLDESRARLVISLGVVLAGLFALTVKSQRNTEYLGPVVVLWCAALWSLVAARRLRAEMEKAFAGYGRIGSMLVKCVLGLCVLAVLGKGLMRGWQDLHPARYADDTYARTASAISARATPGDRVFHTSWDEFPFLFATDDRLRYVSGLDPTFLYVTQPALSDELKDVTFGAVTTTREQAWALIHDELHSRFVFATVQNHAPFISVIRSDPRYTLLAQDAQSIAWEVAP